MVQSQAENDPKGGAVPLPPVPSALNSHANNVSGEARQMAPPFVSHTASAPISETAPGTVVPPTAAAAAQTPSQDDEMPWEQDEGDEEGTVEAVFEADVSETEASLAAMAAPTEFPMDAFIIPEESQRVPTGLEGKPIPDPRATTRVSELADRLEKFSHRLRVEDTNDVIARLAAGDRFDTLLAGLLAGFIAGGK
jgi:hypothetical protein